MKHGLPLLTLSPFLLRVQRRLLLRLLGLLLSLSGLRLLSFF